MIEGRKLLLAALGFILTGLFTAVVFLAHPELDLAISGYFSDGANGFPLRQHPVAKFFNDLINVMALVMALACMIGWSIASRMRMKVAGIWARHYAFLLGALVLGPGLIANGLFKENWGRARPRQVTEFGGTADFSAPLVIADQCSSNCSFVSGDASMGFYFLALALVTPKKTRRLAILAALAFGLFIGFIRVLQGAHFFSDVVFAGVFVGLAIVFLYRLMLGPWLVPEGATPPGIAAQLGFTGNASINSPGGKSKLWLLFRATPKDLGVEDNVE